MSGFERLTMWLLSGLFIALCLLRAYGCVGKPAVCATSWSASVGTEQNYQSGRIQPTSELTVGGELGGDKCKETSDGE